MTRKAQLGICWIAVAGSFGCFVWGALEKNKSDRLASMEFREARTKAERDGFELGFQFGLEDLKSSIPHRGMDWKLRIGRMQSAGRPHPTDFQIGFMNGYDEAFR